MEKFTLSRGLSDLFIAEVTEDNEENYTTGTPEKLIPAGEMSVSVDKDAANYWFDNTIFAIVGREGASEITISGAGLRAADIAKLTGKDVDTASGAVFDDGQYREKYYAFGGVKKNIDGTTEHFWFNKGSFAIPDENAKTEGEDTDATGLELTYTAIPTTHRFEKTGKVNKKVVLDSTAGNTADIENWFTAVKTPDNMTGTITAE